MRSGFVLILFFVSIAYSKSVKKSVVGLYGSEDNVTILTGENFNKTIFNSQYIWLVEFYSSWCGHCQQFAPTFKAFGKSIAEWQNIYRLAVINCPEDANRPSCSQLSVRGYPEMRIFQPFSNFSNPGVTIIGANTVDSLRNVTMNYVEKYLSRVGWNLDGVMKPTFEFATYENVINFFKRDKAPYYLTIVVENEASEMGKKIILDMSSCRNISTRRFNSASPELDKFAAHFGVHFNALPTVIVISKDGKAKEVEVTIRKQSFYAYKLRNMPGVGDPVSIPKENITVNKEDLKKYIDWKTIDRGKTYMADIEAGIRYALTVEIGSINVLQDETLDAVKTFIGTLALFSENLPVRETTKKFLVRLTEWLAGMMKIDHVIWQQRIETFETDNYLPPVDQKWAGCAPSKLLLRGYPCSLWTLFHSLTVAAYNADEQDFEKIPVAMEAYILNFFGCVECRKNFVKELIDNPYEENLKSNKDVVLWLWELHNKVNKRLHGAISEDPNIPKVQFPPVDICDNCRNTNGEWNRDIVLKYLIDRYSLGKVSEEFLEKMVIKIPRPQVPVNKNINRYNPHGRDRSYENFEVDLEVQAKFEDHDFDNGDKSYSNPKNMMAGVGHPHLVKELLLAKRKDHPMDVLREFGGDSDEIAFEGSWHNTRIESGLTVFDTSLCFLLWATSMIVVGLLYYHMHRRNLSKYCKAP